MTQNYLDRVIIMIFFNQPLTLPDPTKVMYINISIIIYSATFSRARSTVTSHLSKIRSPFLSNPFFFLPTNQRWRRRRWCRRIGGVRRRTPPRIWTSRRRRAWRPSRASRRWGSRTICSAESTSTASRSPQPFSSGPWLRSFRAVTSSPRPNPERAKPPWLLSPFARSSIPLSESECPLRFLLFYLRSVLLDDISRLGFCDELVWIWEARGARF